MQQETLPSDTDFKTFLETCLEFDLRFPGLDFRYEVVSLRGKTALSLENNLLPGDSGDDEGFAVLSSMLLVNDKPSIPNVAFQATINQFGRNNPLLDKPLTFPLFGKFRLRYTPLKNN